MSDRHQAVRMALADCVARLDVILRPWGFVFESDGVRPSHTGPYASGHYCRGATRIGLSCRDTIDNLYYEHSFTTNYAFHREIESFTIGHDSLMRRLGHEGDCWLIRFHRIPDVIAARDGGDRVAALIHDLQVFASPVLCAPCEEFYAIVRRGSRGLSIETRSSDP
jgi:hypothetical protein